MKNETLRSAVAPFLASSTPERAFANVQNFKMNGVLRLDVVSEVPYSGGDLWKADVPRALGRKTHGWFFLRDWTAAWTLMSTDQKESLLADFEQMFGRWENIVADSEQSMAYHDETTAQRLMNFAIFIDAIKDEIDTDGLVRLLNFADSEIRILASDSFYAGNNNHGMFQDISLLVAEAYGFEAATEPEIRQTAVDRLTNYFVSSFNEDGIHRENNPTYHLMVARYLDNSIKYFEATGESTELDQLRDIERKADLYGAYALTPANEFVPISDTKKGPILEQQIKDVFGDGPMLAAHSNGASGEPPTSRTFVTSASGYAVYRSDWSPEAEYLFFSAAYNADYHKHSDELSIVYHAHGRTLITEAGPNGYEYSDPLTAYGFSSAAHNTLLVDDEGLPRIDTFADRTILRDLGSTPTSLDVEGSTGRYPGVQWSRRVTTSDEKEGRVVINDKVSSQRERKFTFLWHIAENTKTIVRGNAFEIFDSSGTGKLAEMTWSEATPTSVRVVQGQRHPYVQGWIFPRMGKAVPATVVEVTFREKDLDIRWDLRSCDFKLVDRGVIPESQWQNYLAEKPVNYLLDLPEDGGKINQLAVVFTAVGQLNDFTYNYRTSLKGFPGATLYILDDFGDQGAYYLASNRNLAEFRSVQSLIRTKVAEFGLPWNRVTTVGSSKGGTAALLHGVYLGVGQVYSGGPQYKIGDFVKTPHPNILRYIAGGESEAEVAWLNEIPFSLLQSGFRGTEVSILVGRGDHHHRNHAVPLIDDMRMLGYRPQFLQLPGTPHAELGSVFRGFVQSFVSSSQSGGGKLPHAVAYDQDTQKLGIAVSLPPYTKGWGQLVKAKERIGKPVELKSGIAQWSVEDEGIYRVRVYFESNEWEDRQAFGSSSVRV